MEGNSRYLTNEENDTIISILEDEEFNLGMDVNRSNLSILDEKCRQIWPEWQSSPVSAARRTPQRVVNQDELDTAAYERPRISPIRGEIDREELAKLDTNSLKAEVDALMSRIRGVTGVTSPPKSYESPSRDYERRSPRSYEAEYSPRQREIPDYLARNREAGSYCEPEYSPRQREIPEYSPRSLERTDYLPRNREAGSYETEYSPRQREVPDYMARNYQSEYSPRSRAGVDLPGRSRPSPSRSMHVQFVQSAHVPEEETISKEDLESLRSENLKLKAELLKIEKRLELETEENRKLVASLENSERIRASYKQRLAASPPR